LLEGLADIRIVEAAIALTTLEALCLIAYRWRSGRGISPARLLPNLCAGLLLMLGIFAALVGASWPWLPVCLVAAGAAHALDIGMRWNRA
jgi:hypothetical protein